MLNKLLENKKSIKFKLVASYGILIALLIVMSVLSIVNLNASDSRLNHLVNGAIQADAAVKMCRVDINVAARTVREMALNRDVESQSSYRAQFTKMMDDLGVQIESLSTAGVIDEEVIQEYSDRLTEWANTAYIIIGTIEDGNYDEASDMILNQCAPALDEVTTLSLAISEDADALVVDAVAASQRVFIISIILIVADAVVTLLIALYAARSIIRSITSPLQELENATKELSKGNLHVQIDYHAEDEMGALADSLRDSITTLSTYVDDISRMMREFEAGNFTVQPEVDWRGNFLDIKEAFLNFEDTIAEVVSGIKGVAEQVESGAGQVSESSMDLAQGATEQASVTEEFAATIETVSDQVTRNAEYAKDISKQVETVGGEILNSDKKMQEMVHSMKEINDSSQKIHKIIDSINEIASQTSLLALNAAIEAARAGEAGRGFAVVADQVSALASQSAVAAKESTVLIETSVEEVQKGMTLAEEAAKGLEKVVTDSHAITEEVNKVASELEIQTESFEQINIGINQINDVVQTNAATSQQCAANSQEMSNQASTLEGLIGKFRLKSAM